MESEKKFVWQIFDDKSNTDIEGGEYALFKSLDPTLLNKIDRIAVETHSEEENVSFHLPGKIRHEFFWDYGGGSQTMFYFITPK